MPCMREGKLLTVGRYLACQVLTFFPSDCATLLLGREDKEINISAASKGLSPLLTGRAPPFEEALDWLHFDYNTDQTGDCVAPLSTFLVQSAVVEGGELIYGFLAAPSEALHGGLSPGYGSSSPTE